MGKNFKYAPGLVAVGSTGIDGSVGITGITPYITTLNGLTNQVDIKSKLINNKILSAATDEVLPAGRVYQDGDLIIDGVGDSYIIDFNKLNYYKSTGTNILFTFTNIFTKDLISETTTAFERWYNKYLIADDQKLVDIVYTSDSALGNSYLPTSGSYIDSSEFALVHYNDIISFNEPEDSIYAFTAYRADDTAMGIVHHRDENFWHFGNRTKADVLGDASLALDFASIFFAQDLSINDASVGGNVSGYSTIVNILPETGQTTFKFCLGRIDSSALYGTKTTLWSNTATSYNATSQVATAVNWFSWSDESLKENFKSYGLVLDKILSLSGSLSHFDWIEQKMPGVGYTAQTLGKVFPDFLGPVKDPTSDKQLSINYKKLSGVSLEGIAELYAKIEIENKELEHELDMLEVKLDKLMEGNAEI